MSRAAALPPPRLAIAAAVALALAGCGESRRESSSTATTAAAPAPPAAPKGDFSVTLREYSIAPQDLDVPKPGSFTLAIRNAGRVPHALEIEGRTGEVKTGAIAPGRTATLTVTLAQAGRYQWYCPIDGHRGRGMRGAVIVAGGAKRARRAEDKPKQKHRTEHGGGSSSEPTGGAPAPRGDSSYP